MSSRRPYNSMSHLGQSFWTQDPIPCQPVTRHRLSHPDIYWDTAITLSPQHRRSNPEIFGPSGRGPLWPLPPVSAQAQTQKRRVLPAQPGGGGVRRMLLKRCTNPDLMMRTSCLQRTSEIRADSHGSRSGSQEPIDPVYLALKQAHGRYSRRGSSSNFDSATPSPRNLSQVSLQDSGFVEMKATAPMMLGSTPQLDTNSTSSSVSDNGRSVGRRRAPKLTQQMKSLSLDCQDMPPRMNQTARSPLRSKLTAPAYKKSALNGSSDFSDAERSCSPVVKSRRSSSSATNASGGHIVIHEYAPSHGAHLTLGEKLHVVDNGDPDWLHGFRYNDRTEHILTFPATCVAQIYAGEKAMKVERNVFVADQKLRMYRDQIVFVQPDSLIEGKVTVRTAHNAYAPCPLSSLALI